MVERQVNIFDERTAAEYVAAWKGEAPNRAYRFYGYAAEAARRCAQISLTQGAKQMARNYEQAAALLENAAATLRRGFDDPRKSD